MKEHTLDIFTSKVVCKIKKRIRISTPAENLLSYFLYWIFCKRRADDVTPLDFLCLNYLNYFPV